VREVPTKAEQYISAMRFLWGAFNIALDVYKTSDKLFDLYVDTIEKMIKFTVAFNRENEFKKTSVIFNA